MTLHPATSEGGCYVIVVTRISISILAFLGSFGCLLGVCFILCAVTVGVLLLVLGLQ